MRSEHHEVQLAPAYAAYVAAFDRVQSLKDNKKAWSETYKSSMESAKAELEQAFLQLPDRDVLKAKHEDYLQSLDALKSNIAHAKNLVQYAEARWVEAQEQSWTDDGSAIAKLRKLESAYQDFQEAKDGLKVLRSALREHKDQKAVALKDSVADVRKQLELY